MQWWHHILQWLLTANQLIKIQMVYIEDKCDSLECHIYNMSYLGHSLLYYL